MGLMSRCPARLISIGLRSPQILLNSHFSYLKTSNTAEVWYFFTIKTNIHFLSVLMLIEVLQNLKNNESGRDKMDTTSSLARL